MTFSLETIGTWQNTESWLKRMSKGDIFKTLDQYGKMGVEALAQATPKESGETAGAWSYRTSISGSRAKIEWLNNHVNQGVNIAVILQYGHGTGTGGYVQGRDYINPAIRPVFDKITESVWKEVTRA